MAVVDRWLSDEYMLTTILNERYKLFPPSHTHIAHTHSHSFGSSHRAVFFSQLCFDFLVAKLFFSLSLSLSKRVWFIQPNFQSEMMKSFSTNRDEDIHVSASDQYQQIEK